MTYPLVRELAADGIAVAVTCRVLKIARGPYYRWLAVPVTASEWDEALITNMIHNAYRDDPEFGYRLIADEVRAAGQPVSDRTTWKICSQRRWWCAFGKKHRSGKRPGAAVHDDLVRRQFTADGPDRVWLADITEHRNVADGKLYLCAIKDLWSNRIIGYSIGDRMKAGLAVAALNHAVTRRGDVTGCIVHSDRGSQFRSRQFVRTLRWYNMIGSMGRVGAPGDNAAIESFFSLLQKNVLNWRRWDTHDQLRLAIVTWIERTYHRRRRQTALGKLTPIEFETIMNPTQAHAA